MQNWRYNMLAWKNLKTSRDTRRRVSAALNPWWYEEELHSESVCSWKVGPLIPRRTLWESNSHSVPTDPLRNLRFASWVNIPLPHCHSLFQDPSTCLCRSPSLRRLPPPSGRPTSNHRAWTSTDPPYSSPVRSRPQWAVTHSSCVSPHRARGGDAWSGNSSSSAIPGVPVSVSPLPCGDFIACMYRENVCSECIIISCRGYGLYSIRGPKRGVRPEWLRIAVYGDGAQPCVCTMVVWSGKSVSLVFIIKRRQNNN